MRLRVEPELVSGKDIPYIWDGMEARTVITSRLTSKSQTTIPQPIRAALHLKEGDALAYRIEDGRVILSRADPVIDDPFATFGEWDGEADRKAYAGL